MPQPQPTVSALDHLVLTVADIPQTIRFYESVMGMMGAPFETATGEVRWSLTFGRMKINLHQAGQEFEPKAARPTSGSGDLCFLTETPLQEWQDHLAAQGVLVEEGPVRRTGAVSPLTSLYVRDPDGNLIEIAVAD